MSDYKIHEIASSSGARKDALEKIHTSYGRVPNVLGALAESPAALTAYHGVSQAVSTMTFTPIERHVIWFTINREHGCHYCMAAHMPGAIQDKVPDEVIATARNGGSYADAKLDALRAFTLAMVQERGWVSPEAVDTFLSAGFSRENIFEIIAIIAQKVMTNYTNHIVEPPLDKRYQAYRWTEKEIAS